MASFDIAYNKYVKPIEGGYSNVASDKGGETYAGISRPNWPTWSGWAYIDGIKTKSGTIKRYTKFPALDAAVTAFYKNMWDRNYFGYINNQDVSNILFDWYVNSGSLAFDTRPEETYGVQEILVKWFGKNIAADGAMGMQTVNAINSVDAGKLQKIIKEQRKVFYDYLVRNNSSQQANYKGWIARLAKFPDLVTSKTGIVTIVVLAAVAGLFLYHHYQDAPQKQVAMGKIKSR